LNILNSLQIGFLKLPKANLKLQPDKCKFLKKEASFLGHIVTPNGIKSKPLKIKAIDSYPIPKKGKRDQSFSWINRLQQMYPPDIARQITKGLKKKRTDM